MEENNIKLNYLISFSNFIKQIKPNWYYNLCINNLINYLDKLYEIDFDRLKDEITCIMNFYYQNPDEVNNDDY